MRWLLVLLAASACNRVFGVTGVIEADAQKFDAPIDARFACPAIGTPLQYSPLLHQVIAQPCIEYNASTDRGVAVALCHEQDQSQNYIYEGAIDSKLGPASLTLVTDTAVAAQPRISPEGDLLLVQTYDQPTHAHSAYQHSDSGWTYVGDLPFAGASEISTPSRGPNRHLMVADGTPVLTEWVGDLDTWTQLPATTLDAADRAFHTWLAPDGHRIVISVLTTEGTLETRYADRASIDDPFNAAVNLPQVPMAADIYVTEDCSRLYVSSVDTIFYAQQ